MPSVTHWVADLRLWDAHMVGMEAPARLAELILEAIRPLGSWA